MLLAIDIGNTNIVICLFHKGKIFFNKRLASTITRTDDEIWLLIKHFCEQEKISPEGIKDIVIVSVVPHLTDVVEMMVIKYLKVNALIVDGVLDIGIKLPYDDPLKLGADRICVVVAALKKFSGPLIIVDFGTATTYDVISGKGEYLGGVIAPGVETAGMELFKRTAKLPKVEFRYPESIIGSNTVMAIQSGVMYGAVDAFEGMVRRLRRIVGKYATVVATGGYAQIIAEMSNDIKYLEPNLVLEGARLIYERIDKKRKK